LRALFCAYRDWAVSVYENIKESYPDLVLVRTPEDLTSKFSSSEWDVIFIVGWSWKVEPEIVNNCMVVGMHPSDLPDYAGGSPIQNQILDGITETRASLFKLNEKFDNGDIVDKERIDLSGHLTDVFDSISSATVLMIKRFMLSYPDIETSSQVGSGKKVRRIKPADSRLKNPESPRGLMSCRELWDFIRCREDPYPNAFFEDDTGRLVIKHVEFYPKNSTDS
jgi:methionyl-tRNA formyltransferase